MSWLGSCSYPLTKGKSSQQRTNERTNKTCCCEGELNVHGENSVAIQQSRIEWNRKNSQLSRHKFAPHEFHFQDAEKGATEESEKVAQDHLLCWKWSYFVTPTAQLSARPRMRGGHHQDIDTMPFFFFSLALPTVQELRDPEVTDWLTEWHVMTFFPSPRLNVLMLAHQSEKGQKTIGEMMKVIEVVCERERRRINSSDSEFVRCRQTTIDNKYSI